MNYDEKETDSFIELADYIEEHIPGIDVQGNPIGAAPAGVFSVAQEGGDVLFERSKGSTVDFKAIVTAIQSNVASGGSGPAVGCM